MIIKLLKDYKKMKKDDLIKQLIIKTLILDEIEGYCSLPLEEGEFTFEEAKWLEDFNNDILGIIKHRSKMFREEIERILGEDIKEIPQFEGTLEQLDKLSIRGKNND